MIGSQPASASIVRQIDGCRSSGLYAYCSASGTARHHPSRIVVHVRATPRQSVDVSWSITCYRGFKFGSTSGDFSSGTPINRVLPHGVYHPYKCDVYASGFLSHRGSLHLWLTYRNWS